MWKGVDTPAESWRLENLKPPAKPTLSLGEGPRVLALRGWPHVWSFVFGV